MRISVSTPRFSKPAGGASSHSLQYLRRCFSRSGRVRTAGVLTYNACPRKNTPKSAQNTVTSPYINKPGERSHAPTCTSKLSQATNGCIKNAGELPQKNISIWDTKPFLRNGQRQAPRQRQAGGLPSIRGEITGRPARRGGCRARNNTFVQTCWDPTRARGAASLRMGHPRAQILASPSGNVGQVSKRS